MPHLCHLHLRSKSLENNDIGQVVQMYTWAAYKWCREATTLCGMDPRGPFAATMGGLLQLPIQLLPHFAHRNRALLIGQEPLTQRPPLGLLHGVVHRQS